MQADQEKITTFEGKIMWRSIGTRRINAWDHGKNEHGINNILNGEYRVKFIKPRISRLFKIYKEWARVECPRGRYLRHKKERYANRETLLQFAKAHPRLGCVMCITNY